MHSDAVTWTSSTIRPLDWQKCQNQFFGRADISFWHRNSSSKVNIKTELHRKMNRKRRKKNNSQKPIRIFMSSFPHESHTPRTTSLIERLYIQYVSCVHVSDFWFLWICFFLFLQIQHGSLFIQFALSAFSLVWIHCEFGITWPHSVKTILLEIANDRPKVKWYQSAVKWERGWAE